MNTSKHRILAEFAAGTLLPAPALAPATKLRHASQSPNIVLFLADDLGYGDLGQEYAFSERVFWYLSGTSSLPRHTFHPPGRHLRPRFGRPFGFTDEDLANEILAAARDGQYSVSEFIHALVESKPFQRK